MTSKKYRPWNPDQAYLFPPSMRDWLEEEARQAKVEELRERAAIQRRAGSTEPDPRHNCPIFKDSQSESQ